MSMEKTTENSGFLDGRDYTAAFLYEFCSLLVGNGVYAGELAPTATNENMTITHGSGHAWINGVCYKNTTPFILNIATADGSLNRYDSLMLRLDLSKNETYAVIVQGKFASKPTPPAVTRNAETYELKICDIYVPAGCTKITQAQITDTRLDNSVCGVPVFPVEHLDMTTFYRQVATDLSQFKQKEQTDFTAWVAGQKQINLATLSDLVEIVRNTSNSSRDEILDLLAQLNELVEGDPMGKLIDTINEKVPKSGGTMTGNLSVPAPTAAAHAANKEYVDGRLLSYSVVLSASKWSSNLQTVTVSGVTADATKTDVLASPAPSDGNYTAYMESGVRLYAQLDGAVQFKCTDVPSVDLTVNLLVRR